MDSGDTTDSTAAGAVISVPAGGGAIQGLGEKFTPDEFTGTGNMSVPLALPPGRAGATPSLSLTYSTGTGNGPFGLGWQLTLPGVSRKTSDGIPVYADDADVFVLSGSEDLVPVAGSYPGRVRYRPRTEGLFARIEHVRDDSGNYWEVRAKDGSLTRYGSVRTAGADPGRDPAVVADPFDAGRVFGWRVTETVDPLGNLIRYSYLPDSGDAAGHRWSQPLPARIAYADYGDRDAPRFLVTVDFEYSERPDPFSGYRSGFEVRTSLRCHTIRVTTHAADGVDRISREYRLGYDQASFNGRSLLARIESVGIDGAQEEALPALTFAYSSFDPAGRRFAPVTGPVRQGPETTLVDLRGAGLPDLVELGPAARVWRNSGHGHFELPRPMSDAPPYFLTAPGVRFIDANGDGRPDLMVPATGAATRAAGQVAGYFPAAFADGWSRRSFTPYRSSPAVSVADPQVRLVDLDGDGLTDVLRSGDRLQAWFNDRDPGRAWQRTAVSNGSGLPVDLSDPRVRLADMTGDGLEDLVLLRSGTVSYWPNLGHNRWGNRVTMRNSPRLPDGFDPRRVLLGDIDGDGAADLLYVDRGRVTLWGNQSGNGWTEAPVVVSGTPEVTGTDALQLSDLYGTGMAGLLFSRPTGPRSGMRFLDFTGGVKPGLLSGVDNGLGALTRITYRASTQEYLRDAADPATRWRTVLPFPVHVTTRIESADQISGGTLTSEYRYRHGYWDGVEREFRGFAFVERQDTETFRGDGVPDEHYSPPLLTRTWFHPGPVAAAASGDWIELDLSDEYWPGDPPVLSRPASILAALPRDARRSALRTLRGQALRTELYALDGASGSGTPYAVSEALSDVREETPGLVFFPFPIGQRTTQWDRGPDPAHRFTFPAGYDAYGFPAGQIAVAVARGSAGPHLSTYTTTEYARRDDAGHYIVDRVARTTTYEVVNDGTLPVTAFRDAILAGQARLRTIGHIRNLYDGPEFTGSALGSLGEHGLSVRSEKLAFPARFLDDLYPAGAPRPPYLTPGGAASWPAEYPAAFRAGVPELAGYRFYSDTDVPGSPGGYYVETEMSRYDVHVPGATPRGLRLASLDPLGAMSRIAYDQHDLLPVRSTDPAALTTAATYDYRVLLAGTVTDPNGATTALSFSPAGMVTGTFVRGHDGDGDVTAPSVAMSYDLRAYADRREPASIRTQRRVHHDSETGVPAAERDDVLVSVAYFDGFARLLQTRSRAEDTLFGDPAFGGNVIPGADLAPAGDSAGRTRTGGPDNVVVSGWQVYDNKNRVVRKYEPFFSTGYDFAPPRDAQLGQRATLFYDARGRLERTLFPDGSEQRTVFGIPIDLSDPDHYLPTAWESYTYDANDNAGRTHGDAAASYRTHWNTPASTELDALGRVVKNVARNGTGDSDRLVSLAAYDIQGNQVSITDPLGRIAFAYRYDLLKRRWRTDGIDRGREDSVLDAAGQAIEARDGRGALILGQFDPLHRVSRVWTRDDAAGAVALSQTVEYGDGGDPAQPAADRAAARASYLLGRPARHRDGAGLLVTDAGDFKGNVVRSTRRMIADAPLLAAYAGAAAKGWQVRPFRADWTPAAGQSPAARDTQLLEPSGYTGTTAYDALNRVTSRVLPADASGHRAELRSTFNRGGALESVTLDRVPYVRHIAYDAKGRRVLFAAGNAVLTRFAYDPLTFRMARQRTEPYVESGPLSYRPAGNAILDRGYDYDLRGNIIGIRDRAAGSGIPGNPEAASIADPVLRALVGSGDALNRRFTQDPVYRLRSATGREYLAPPAGDPWLDSPRGADVTRSQGYTESYSYDAAGNLLGLTHAGTGGLNRKFAVEPGSNRLRALAIGSATYAYHYDPAGNLVSETDSRKLSWDHANRLMAFATQTAGAEPSVHAQYLYDATGQRLKKLVRRQGGAVEVTHYVDGVFEHHRWAGGENNHLHVMDDEQRVALVRVGAAQPGDQGPAIAYHVGDHLGSSTAVVDDKGVLTNHEEYTPYGETSFGGYTRKRYRFTGMERDEESGLQYHQARYLAVWLGRWVACDPLGAPGGVNQYQYARDMPTDAIDPSGTDPKPAAGGSGAGSGAGSGSGSGPAGKDPKARDTPAKPAEAKKPPTVFHPGVEHNHKPSGKWAEIQQNPDSDWGPSHYCKKLSPRELIDKAQDHEMDDKPTATEHLNWYRDGHGKEFNEDKNLEKLLRTDPKVQWQLSRSIPADRKSGVYTGHMKVEQEDYTNLDLQYSFGAIDRLDFEVDFDAGTLHAWFQDRYEWHPVYPFYDKQPDDSRRGTNCVHAAAVEMKLEGAQDYWMKGEVTIPLSSSASPVKRSDPYPGNTSGGY